MFSSGLGSTGYGRNPVDRAKPFDIPKREVWEAYKSVRANQGAAGVDGPSIADFEADLSNNLYKLWNRLASGSYFPPPVRRGGHTEGRWSNPAAGDTHSRRSPRPDGGQKNPGAARGTTLPRRLVRVSTWQIGAEERAAIPHSVRILRRRWSPGGRTSLSRLSARQSTPRDKRPAPSQSWSRLGLPEQPPILFCTRRAGRQLQPEDITFRGALGLPIGSHPRNGARRRCRRPWRDPVGSA